MKIEQIINNNSHEKVIEEIVNKIKANRIDEALDLIVKIKAERVHIEKIDMLRAFCFIQKNDLVSAKKALNDELANFPENNVAREMLKSMSQLTTENMFIADYNTLKEDDMKNYSNSFHDDIYIVEFPKSGITWLSFLIGNINLMLSKMDIKITFYNVHQIIIDIHQLRGSKIKSAVTPFPPFRFIKSHDEYNPNYLFVIYLLRNPFDVMLSYFKHMKWLGYNGSFNSFIRDKNLGVDAWKKHVESWMENQDFAQRFMFLRYEDLKYDTLKVLKRVYNNLGITVNDDIYLKAIEYSSFESMKYSEEYYRETNPRYKMIFIREGKIGGEMRDESHNFIREKTINILKKFYPEFL